MNYRKLSLFGAILVGLGLQTIAKAAQSPNFYECSGRKAHLTLAVGSKAEVGILPPQTTLNLQLGDKRYTFGDADITTEPTLIGDLWEVTLEHVPDLYIKHASVVIPSISLGESPLTFTSQLILTTVATPFSPVPFEGVVNSSKYIDLACTASIVYY